MASWRIAYGWLHARCVMLRFAYRHWQVDRALRRADRVLSGSRASRGER